MTRVVEKAIEIVNCVRCVGSQFGITWIVPRQSPRVLLACPETLLLYIGCLEDLEFCLCILKWLHKYSDVTLQLYINGKMPCLTLIVTLGLDLHIADVSSPTLHSAVVLFSVVSRLRAGSHVIGWPSWMEWDGGNKGQVAMTFFSSLCLPLAFPWKAT